MGVSGVPLGLLRVRLLTLVRALAVAQWRLRRSHWLGA
jgi:hypothetical protein